MDKEQNMKNALKGMEERVAQIEGFTPKKLIELIRTITQWEEIARTDYHDVWYKLQSLNHKVGNELLKRLK